MYLINKYRENRGDMEGGSSLCREEEGELDFNFLIFVGGSMCGESVCVCVNERRSKEPKRNNASFDLFRLRSIGGGAREILEGVRA